MGTPSKEQWLAAFQVALAGALAAIQRIFAENPNAAAAAELAADYLRKTFAPEVVVRLAESLPAELVALALTGHGEVVKPPSDLS